MSIFSKISTLFSATAHQSLNQLIDQNAILIFEEEISRAEQALPQAKYHLAAVMAERKKLQRDNEMLQQSIRLRIVQANSALDKSEEALARDLADVIAEDESLFGRQQMQIDALLKREGQLTQQMRKSVQAIKHYQRELNLAKANRHAQSALTELKYCSSDLSSSLNEMEKSLNKIQTQQALCEDMNEALAEINEDLQGGGLEQKLGRAGIASGKADGEAVLARLKGLRGE